MMLKLIQLILEMIFKKPATAPTVVVPSADPNDVLVHEAQNWVGTKEVGDNSGPEVERFQRAVNAHPNKEAWCADFVIFCVQQVEEKLGVKSEIYRSELAQDLWFRSPAKMRCLTPSPGNVVVWQHADTSLGHAGIVEAVAKDGSMTTIEGNTAPGVGIVREGDGVYRRFRTQKGTPAMHVLGFLKVF